MPHSAQIKRRDGVTNLSFITFSVSFRDATKSWPCFTITPAMCSRCTSTKAISESGTTCQLYGGRVACRAQPQPPRRQGYQGSACPTMTLLHSGNPTTRREIHVDHGWVAQLAEQWTENPRVGGSIPPPATPLKTRRVQQILQQNLAPDECISCVGTLLNRIDWLSDRLPAR